VKDGASNDRAIGDDPERPNASVLSDDEKSQIAARLRLSPSDRLAYLEDMIAFEEEARRARRLS
jgi:hypothetical protein